jgi:hypothetical protein
MTGTAKAGSIKPVLMILTSPAHPVDTFIMCLRYLQRNTDLSRFKKIYICANEVPGDRFAVIQNFIRRTPNSQDIHCGPIGHHPCVPYVQNLIAKKHGDGPIIKMDDDMFVMPGWLDRLLEVYENTLDQPDLGIILPLIPINTMGIQCLWDFMSQAYGDEFRHMWIRGSGHVGANFPVHRMIWDKIMNHHMIERFVTQLKTPYHYFTGVHAHASINCVLYDHRLIEKTYPFPLYEAWFLDREKMFDESIVNRVISEGRLKGLMVQDTVVHHYSFNKVEGAMRIHFPPPKIKRFLDEVKPLTSRFSGRHKAA